MTNQWLVWAGSWVLSRLRGKKVVLAFHGEAVTWALQSGGRLRRSLIEAGLRGAEALIVVNTHIGEVLAEIEGCAQKTHVLPAFIPPDVRAEDEQSVPAEIREFANTHNPTLLAIGAPVLEQGMDLYGIDMTLDLVEALRDDYPKIGVIWALLDFIGSRPDTPKKCAMRFAAEVSGITGSLSLPRKPSTRCTTWRTSFYGRRSAMAMPSASESASTSASL